jgi:hypothetical protein
MSTIVQLRCILLGGLSDIRERVTRNALKAYFDILYYAIFVTTCWLPKTAVKLQVNVEGSCQQPSI